MAAIVEKGPETITIRGQKVPEWFVDEFGRRYEFDSMAVLDKDGCFKMSQLADNQSILSPGAIYERKGKLIEEKREMESVTAEWVARWTCPKCGELVDDSDEADDWVHHGDHISVVCHNPEPWSMESDSECGHRYKVDLKG